MTRSCHPYIRDRVFRVLCSGTLSPDNPMGGAQYESKHKLPCSYIGYVTPFVVLKLESQPPQLELS